MKNLLEYKGYYGSVEFSNEDETLYGKVLGIKSLISYEGESIKSIKRNFEEAVDGYLDYCKENDIEPEKMYKGSFNIRIAPELHKKLAIYSFASQNSINATVEEAIVEYLADK